LLKTNTKTNSKKLTDAICRSLPRLDKRYYKTGDYPGLEFWVMPSGIRTWKIQYRIKGVKDPLRKKLGNFPVVGVVETTRRIKKIATEIYDGVDPRQREKVEVLKLQLGQVIKT